MAERLIRDHDNTAEQLRKAFTFKDALAVHQAAGCLLHFLGLLESMVPSGEFGKMRAELLNQFMQGFMDADLCHVLSAQVPPGDIKSVAAFRCSQNIIFRLALNVFCLFMIRF